MTGIFAVPVSSLRMERCPQDHGSEKGYQNIEFAALCLHESAFKINKYLFTPKRLDYKWQLLRDGEVVAEQGFQLSDGDISFRWITPYLLSAANTY